MQENAKRRLDQTLSFIAICFVFSVSFAALQIRVYFFFGRHSQNQKNTKKQQNSIKSLCTPFETKNIDICPFRRLAEKQANNVTIELEPR